MSGFEPKMPDGYYTVSVVDKFKDMPNVNYDTKLYQRNPEVQGKLSLNHIEFIEFYVRLLKPVNFIELGVQFGECTKQICNLIPGQYIGVDIQSNSNIEYLSKHFPNFEFNHMDTNTFFNNNKDNLKLEMAFIDASHTHEDTYNDFLNIKDHMVNDGFIFFHDCYPYSEYWTSKTLCGDGYKTSELIRKKHGDEFEILTIPCNPGISVARKCVRQLDWL
jgi:hypothetical protein